MILFDLGSEKRKSEIFLVIFCAYWLTIDQLIDQVSPKGLGEN